MKNKAEGTFIKIAAIHAVTMIIVMVTIGTFIYIYCFEFIKKQRVDYNRQLLSQISYEAEHFFSRINTMLESFSSEDKYSVLQFQPMEKESVFEKIKRQVNFEENVKECIYANGLGGLSASVMMIEDNKLICYKGQEGTSFVEYAATYPPSDSKGKTSILTYDSWDYLKKASGERQAVGFVKSKKRTALISVDMNNIMSLLGASFLEERSFFITDKDGQVIFYKDMERYRDKRKASSGKVNFSDMAKDRKVLLTSLKLDLFAWKLNVVDSKNVVFKDIYQLWMKMFLIIFIGTVINMILFVLITRKVLFPIHLIKRFIHQVGVDSDTYLEVTKGEIGEISQMINTMKEKIKDLTENQYTLEMEMTKSRLQVLQSQMNPHFLHNTLDNIYCIAQVEEIEPITVLAKRLSQMLRYSINTEKMFVTLNEEIEYIKAYIEILSVRYENKISLFTDIEEGLADCYVFRLLIQPLVENACMHGILPSNLSKGEVKIFAKRLGRDIEIIVENNGIILSDSQLRNINENMNSIDCGQESLKKGAGIALSNIKERIRIFYGKEYGLHYERVDGYGTRALILQKYITKEEDCYKAKR